MKKAFRIISLLLILAFSLGIFAFAADIRQDDKFTLDVPIITLNGNETEQDINEIAARNAVQVSLPASQVNNLLGESQSLLPSTGAVTMAPATDLILVGIMFVRPNPANDLLEIYLNIGANCIHSAVRFYSVIVSDPEMINPSFTPIAIGNSQFSYTQFNYVAGAGASVYIGSGIVPRTEFEVRATFSNMQVYSLTSGWVSIAPINQLFNL